MPFGIPALIGAGLQIGGSLFGHKQSSMPVLSPGLQNLQSQLLDYTGGILKDPSAGTMGMRLNGLNQINRNFAAMPDQISRQLAARGFGKSGKLGTAMYDTGAARLGALSDFGAQMDQMILNRQDRAASLGNQLIASGRGMTSNSGGGLGDMLMTGGNALENLTTLRTLASVLSGNGGGGGGDVFLNNPNSYSDPGWNDISAAMLRAPKGGTIPSAPAAPGFSVPGMPSVVGPGLPSGEDPYAAYNAGL